MAMKMGQLLIMKMKKMRREKVSIMRMSCSAILMKEKNRGMKFTL
jgi:hypothetical protein